MSFIAAAVIGGTSLVSGLIGSSGAQSAASTQASADNNATAVQQGMFNTITANEQPFMTAGSGATTALAELLGTQSGSFGMQPNGFLTQESAPTFDANTVTNSPGYQFAQQQGLSQVANAEAPLVGAASGPALKALTNFATGTAAQYYNDYFNQANTVFNQGQTLKNNIFDRLSSLAGLGQNAAGNVGNNGTQLGIGSAQSTAAAGAAQAAGTVGSANALSNGISNAGNMIGLSNLLSSGGASNFSGAYGANGTPATSTDPYLTGGGN